MCLCKKKRKLCRQILHRMTEKDLIIGCTKEDQVCQRELYKKYAGKMMVVCMRYSNNRMEAEDLLQDGFIKIFDNIAKFKQEGSLEGWIRRIIVNIALNKIRATKMLFEDISTKAEVFSNDDATIVDKLSEQDLLNIINKLPNGYKYVFNMYAIEGYSHKEIADNLGIEEASSRSQYAKAKKYLQQKVQHLEKVKI